MTTQSEILMRGMAEASRMRAAAFAVEHAIYACEYAAEGNGKLAAFHRGEVRKTARWIEESARRSVCAS